MGGPPNSVHIQVVNCGDGRGPAPGPALVGLASSGRCLGLGRGGGRSPPSTIRATAGSQCFVHHSDELWVGLPLVVGVLAGTSWLERDRGALLQELAGTLLARAALVVAAIVPPGVALGLLSSALGGDYIPKPGADAQGLAAWGSVRGAAMLVALVAGGLSMMALMALLRVVTGSTASAVALPVAAWAIAIWFLPTTIEQAFLITSEWPWPGGQLAFWLLAVSGPTLCALALAGRTRPGRLRTAP
jgi:hypothetical protein